MFPQRGLVGCSVLKPTMWAPRLLQIVSVLLWGDAHHAWLCDLHVQPCPEVQQGRVLTQRRGLQGWA